MHFVEENKPCCAILLNENVYKRIWKKVWKITVAYFVRYRRTFHICTKSIIMVPCPDISFRLHLTRTSAFTERGRPSVRATCPNLNHLTVPMPLIDRLSQGSFWHLGRVDWPRRKELKVILPKRLFMKHLRCNMDALVQFRSQCGITSSTQLV